MNPLRHGGVAGPELVAFAGDWHGSIRRAEAACRELKHVSTIIHVGDFGYWTNIPGTRKFLYRLNRVLEENDQVLLWIDGNHEDHSRIAKLITDPVTGLQPVTQRIWHIPRGHRWVWNNLVWMGLGGAHSIDRKWRTPGHDWWPEESLTDKDIEYASRPGPVDVMVTHDCPQGVDIPVLRGGSSQWPREDVYASDIHRSILRTVVDDVSPRLLVHGHYHCRYHEQLPLRNGTTCHVHGLGDDGGSLSDNLWVVDPSTI